MLRVRRPLPGEFLRAEQRRNASFDGAIGRRDEPGLLAAGADFGHRRRKRRRLQRQPLRSQGRRDDSLNFGGEPPLPRALRPRQQRRHPPVGTIARQQVIDLPGREAQLGRRPIDCNSVRVRLVQDPVEFARDTARRQPRVVRGRRRYSGGCSGFRSVWQIELSLKSLAENFARFSP